MARFRSVPGEDEPVVPAEVPFSVAEWSGLPEEPPPSFIESYACRGGTKGSLAEEWHLYRAVKAARLRSAARRAERARG